MSEEPKPELDHGDVSVSRSSMKVLASPLFWMASVSVVLLVGSMSTVGLISILVIRDRSDRVKDLQRYQELTAILAEVHAARNSPSPDFSAVRKRAAAAELAMVPDLKQIACSAAPVKQSLQSAVQDELPRMMQGDLLTVTPAEANLVAHLDNAARSLGVK